ncbi:MAG: ABC transporter permease subunit [Pseudomonadota bacterium]
MVHARLITCLLWTAAALSAAATGAVFVFMLILGIPLLTGGHFFQILTGPWQPQAGLYGIFPMIVGTLSISALSITMAFPLSLGCAALIAVIGKGPIPAAIHRLVRFMTGIPTVVYGFVGVFLLVPFIREIFKTGSGMCVLSAALLLAVLIAPTMILLFVDSFARVPRQWLLAVDALGGNRVQKLIRVVIPAAWPGVITGVVLSMGRAMGDTLIALMIAGNAVAVPDGLLASARALTAHIALVIAADFDSLEFQTVFACGIILYGATAVMVMLIRRLGALARERLS